MQSSTHARALTQRALKAFLKKWIAPPSYPPFSLGTRYFNPRYTSEYLIKDPMKAAIQTQKRAPGLIADVFRSAFTGHAGLGGFVGSSIMLSLQQGISRAFYAADIGIGYDSIIHSETSASQIENQARLSMLGVFLDNFICTTTLLIALTSGLWNTSPMLEPALVVQNALAAHFPGQAVFMPIFLFVLVYTTLISFLLVGFKCARFLHPRYGEKAYLVFSVAFLLFFSFFDQSKALLAMSLSGCMLVCLNLLGIYKLRHEVCFGLFQKELVKN